uniref:Uncharacterized protein n=1 Tax=Tanacetum cinerariifolium TaxID=118510 RepID=A0A6L2NNY2_TANCI|nr:hypothetical protein [Tanacetum cinerariifolium]
MFQFNKRKRRHEEKDQDPPAGSDQRMKKSKKSKDVEPSIRPKTTSSSEGTTQSHPKLTGDDMGNTDAQPSVEAALKHDCVEKPQLTFDDFMSTPINFLAFAMNRLKISKLTKADQVGPNYNLLKGMCKSCVELEYNIKACYHALSHQLDWNNLEGERCPYDQSKLLPLHESRGHLTIPADFFFDNDLEYLRARSTDKKYTTSTTKTKAAKYDLEGIEDKVPKVSSHDVYSTIRILSVVSGTVDKWYGYSHLKEIVVRRADHKLYKFMEGDFPRLHLNDIEDMLLLVFQNKLFNLKGDVIIKLAVALHMYTRRIVIQELPKEAQHLQVTNT